MDFTISAVRCILLSKFNPALGNRAAPRVYRSGRSNILRAAILWSQKGAMEPLLSNLLRAVTLPTSTLFIYRPFCYLYILFTQVLVVINTSQILLATSAME